MKLSTIFTLLFLQTLIRFAASSGCSRINPTSATFQGLKVKFMDAPFKGDPTTIREFLDSQIKKYIDNESMFPEYVEYNTFYPAINIKVSDADKPMIGDIYDPAYEIPQTTISNFTVVLTTYMKLTDGSSFLYIIPQVQLLYIFGMMIMIIAAKTYHSLNS